MHRCTISHIDPDSPLRHAAHPGDRLVSINGNPITDVLDYKYYAYDPELAVCLRRPDGTEHTVHVSKPLGGELGLDFETYLMDNAHSCANHCVFCFIDQMPPGMRPTLYFKDDDARLSFLMGNYITLTNLTDEDVQNVIQRNMSPMNVSVHAVSPDVRRRMMGRNAQRGMDVLEAIMAAGIEIHAQIVLCPGMNDGEELLKTLRFCEEHEQITSLGIVPLGFTKHQNRFTWSYSDKPELARETIAMIRPFRELLDGDATTEQLVVTFLAMLELAKRGSLTLSQDEIFGTIRINRVEGAEAYVPGEGPELTE